ncbi:FAD-dependent oxidoreductase [uncultured Brevundimonas sp.]|jgi:glycine/D-amino acid oxidase-like deaminating enzyme|uniref:NAD(P)/FAD-dependent oxidoreductase n=1 Tax=Brevundimonas sp. CEF1 TaxID=3442642 RepID=UPI0025FBFEEB|nr:FAD-dependent oxidoreductase [uncultured Brevundimonas sp.]
MARLTQKRDLRSGRSLWADSPFTGAPVRPLKQAVSVDVAVVGAGISGALMAHELSRDHTLAVLDRRAPLMGSTIASTALLQWEIDLPLEALGRRIGRPKAQRAYLRSRRAVDDLKQIIAQEGIRCGYRDRDALYLAGDAYGRRALESEAAVRVDAGLESCFLPADQVRDRFGIDRTGAILSGGSASADPAQLTAGLLRRAQARGARLFSPVDVIEAVSDPDGVTLLTSTGFAVRASAVVFCCGYERPKGVTAPDSRVVSTWALASTPGFAGPAWLRDTLVWEGSDPYLYMRTSNDGRLIVGGEDEDSPTAHASRALLERKTARILAKLKGLLPEVALEVDYAWAGAFGESASGLPHIAPVPGMAHAWSVMGFGGNGITSSVIASQVVAAWVRGETDPDADLYLA